MVYSNELKLLEKGRETYKDAYNHSLSTGIYRVNS